MNAPTHPQGGWPLEKGFQLGEFRIDPRAGEVTGPGGAEKLDPKVMDVLVALAEHAGQVVLREDLLSRLWPNAVVTDDALSRCIYELRRQLSQAGGDESFKAMLETVPKRGYRLNAEITPLPAAAAAPRQPGRKWAAVAVAGAILAAAGLWFTLGPRAAASIAVLPFVDMSSGQDQGYFSDGVSEEILNLLNKAPDLTVSARTSSFAFRQQAISIPEIAEKLGVTHVLEGSVRRSGDRIRITARLVEASSNSQQWSETFDRAAGDLFAVQDEIAASVATALRTTLEGAAPRGPTPESAAARDLFYRGQYFYNRRAPGDIERAAKHYHEALEIEPAYAQAWASLAGAYSLLAYQGAIPRDVALAKQGEAARKAVELDPNLAMGYARLSQYHWDIGDPGTGYKIWDKARALDPDDPLVLNFSAGLAMRDGDASLAIKYQRRLLAQDPISAGPRANLGTYLQAAGKLEEAKNEFRKALELNPDLGPGVDLAVARILVLQGRFDEARAAIARLPEAGLRDHGNALLTHAEGRRAEADAALERLVEQSTMTPDIRLAEVYAFHGQNEEAFEALQGLQDAIEWNHPSIVSQIWSWQVELWVSPFLKSLHGDLRWQGLVDEPPFPTAASAG
ncbi:MAG: tetratricopeptide repeat protein [Steroidobacteraceae bacterium]